MHNSKDELARRERIQADARDYYALYAEYKGRGCGAIAAAKGARLGSRRARRLWNNGVQAAGLPSIRDIKKGLAELPPGDAASLEAPEVIQKEVTKVVQKEAQRAAGAVVDQIAEAMAQMTEAQTKLYLQSAKALGEEAALVDNARRTSLSMLGRLITVVRASGPMMDMLAARIASDASEMTVPQALSYAGKLAQIGMQIVDLGDKSIALRRRLLGEAEQTIGVIAKPTQDALSPEDAMKELEEIATLVAQANAAAGARTIDVTPENVNR